MIPITEVTRMCMKQAALNAETSILKRPEQNVLFGLAGRVKE